MRFQFAALQFGKELSEIERQTEQIKLGGDIGFTPHEETSELAVTLEDPESSFYLNGTVHPNQLYGMTPREYRLQAKQIQK